MTDDVRSGRSDPIVRVYKYGSWFQFAALVAFLALWQIVELTMRDAAVFSAGIATVGMAGILVAALVDRKRAVTVAEGLAILLSVGSVLGGLIAILLGGSWALGLGICVVQFLVGIAILLFIPQN